MQMNFFQTLGFYEQSFDENRDFSARQTILQIMHELEHAPTADVVEVVRCKDCKKYKESKSFSGEVKMYCDELTEDWLIYMKPDDFCSYGERNLSDY